MISVLFYFFVESFIFILMEEKLRKKAIDLFIAQYGVAPLDKGFLAIDIDAAQDSFLFGVDESALTNYKKANKLNDFAGKTLWVSPLFVLLIYGAGIGLCFFPHYKELFIVAICVFFCAFLAWGCFLVYKSRKFYDARGKSDGKVISLFYETEIAV